jgi:Cellulase (glycosyl hydrolase family 5)
MQLSEFAALNSSELSRLDDVVDYATGKGLKIEIEPHDFGYGFNALVGSAQTPNSAFADFWGKLAQHFASNANVIFGLMNEPHDQSATTWLASANAAIAAIRASGAVSQEILVPGSYWDGAWTWTSSDNAAVIGTGVQDPAHNFAFEVHQYLDADGSGTHPRVVSPTIGVERLSAITQWAEATGSHLFLGEVGVTTDQTSLHALDLMLTYMQQHTDVWQGATYFTGGPWLGSYTFSIEPKNGVDRPQMAILLKHLMLPTLTVSNAPNATNSEVIDLSSLVTIADPANVRYQKLELWDSKGTVAGGQFVVNGVAQTGGHEIDVTPANVTSTVFKVGTVAGTDTLQARLLQTNGTLTAWKTFSVTVPAPALSVHSVTGATPSQQIALSNLVTIADPGNVGYQKLELWDSKGTVAGGQFIVMARRRPVVTRSR